MSSVQYDAIFFCICNGSVFSNTTSKHVMISFFVQCCTVFKYNEKKRKKETKRTVRNTCVFLQVIHKRQKRFIEFHDYTFTSVLW